MWLDLGGDPTMPEDHHPLGYAEHLADVARG